MKRMMCVLMILAVLASMLTGCGISSGNYGENSVTKNSGSAQTDAGYAVQNLCYGGYDSYSSYNGYSDSYSSYYGYSDSYGNYNGYSGSYGVLTGYWGGQIARSRGRSYPFGMQEPPRGDMGYTVPFVLNTPLRACRGFTLNYRIMEISHGNLEGNFRYEVLVHTVQGQWKSAGLFKMDGYSATVQVRMDEPRGIDAIAVVCGKQDDVVYSFDFTVSNPV